MTQEIKLRRPQDLIRAEYNPRQMSVKQHAELVDSIKEFGLVQPILVNTFPGRENVIIGGHMRNAVAMELGFKEVATIELCLDPEKEKELNLRLNHALGDWDWDALLNLDEDLLRKVGFTEKELTGGDGEPLIETEDSQSFTVEISAKSIEVKIKYDDHKDDELVNGIANQIIEFLARKQIQSNPRWN